MRRDTFSHRKSFYRAKWSHAVSDDSQPRARKTSPEFRAKSASRWVFALFMDQSRPSRRIFSPNNASEDCSTITAMMNCNRVNPQWNSPSGGAHSPSVIINGILPSFRFNSLSMLTHSSQWSPSNPSWSSLKFPLEPPLRAFLLFFSFYAEGCDKKSSMSQTLHTVLDKNSRKFLRV